MGAAASKASLIWDSAALMMLVGVIIYGDSECWKILITNSMEKVLFIAGVPYRFPITTIRSQSTL